MTIGIIAAMAEELAFLRYHLEEREDHEVLGVTYSQGRLGQQDVVLVQSGIGKVMSAMSVAVLADHFGVQAIINTGSAGAVAPGIAVGDLVLSEKLVYHDVDVTAFGYAYGQMAQQDLYFSADQTMLDCFRQVAQAEGMTCHQGLIATGDSFVADPERVAAIKEHFPDVLAVEMEGAAIAQAAQAVGLPVMVVRSMSDTADHDAQVSFDDFIFEAGKRSAQLVLNFLKAYQS
ncbi:5'-methylthioadenosine/adenosylhomocysteine nucleosidase [Streptococcus sp. DD12]|uniref:5'-methylthioadenosine/adenosylhomocysteine nucleosidase n=1 Tax=Streptococcus sp. DD12 TaxID=1777880 RepID=UPI000796FEF3|nr:5'-methylthioadenosine/adenosylhomocysteine nucleosidase [Streptococcus sp. DD12]KXT75883.1 5'-methylthioadenosine nucleosidase / S-adenosylhomocysteine nucleosidase [Streptococcus sp. DD12]